MALERPSPHAPALVFFLPLLCPLFLQALEGLVCISCWGSATQSIYKHLFIPFSSWFHFCRNCITIPFSNRFLRILHPEIILSVNFNTQSCCNFFSNKSTNSKTCNFLTYSISFSHYPLGRNIPNCSSFGEKIFYRQLTEFKVFWITKCTVGRQSTHTALCWLFWPLQEAGDTQQAMLTV